MLRFILMLFLLIQNIQLAYGADFEWDEAVNPAVLASLQKTQGLRVFWWNIHDGRPAQTPSSSLSLNMHRLIHSDLAPDIIAFAEYRDASLSSSVLKELRAAYPFNQEWSYPQKPGFGLVLFSKYPFIVSGMRALDFTPLQNITEAERESYRKIWCDEADVCQRMFASFDVDINGKIIRIIPTHLYDAWRKFSKMNGKVQTAQEIIFGQNNPVGFQLSRFRTLLNEKLNPPAQIPPTVVMGDFNIPKDLLGMQPIMYKSLKQNLREVFKTNEITFPAKSAVERGHYPMMQIDHAFMAGPLRSNEAQVLTLRGSDHYPFYMVLDFTH